ncbi:BQ5605_C004g02897 [Microbotryum silenes-dioicae]|uniref:BQ5605_C004g02897 protein n=1 Tax=Microbotryum silenes-dioicae TaxID=796604 RepID=A0A2X0MD90_9BASI|nr:BQ5605_C004g02897 [Microbotryum silenes-dioicae]
MAKTRTIQEAMEIMTGPGMPWETEEKTIKGRTYPVYKQLPSSMREFWLATKTPFGSRKYIVYDNESYTYAEAHTRVAALAALFHSRGVRKGDRVAICARNLPEFIFSFWAAASIGAIISAVNAWGTLDVLMHCFQMVECKLLVLDQERVTKLAEQQEELARLGCSTILVARPSKSLPKGMESMDQALAGCSDKQMPKVSIAPEDNATIYFTSGTTSKPKGVLATNRQFLSNRLNTSVAGARATLMKGLSLPVPDPNAQKAVLLSVPLFHVIGAHSFLTLMTAMGGKVVMMHKYSAEKASELIIRERVTLAGGVPHMVLEIVDRLSRQSHALEALSFGGGPASSRLPEMVKKSIGEVPAGQGFGLTETNSVATSVAGEEYVKRPTSCGLPTPVTRLKIIDPATYEELPTGKTGEICIHGPNIAEGYYRNEKATKEAFTEDGWFKSGDMGHVDEEGYLYVSDRAKDIIIRGGENIASIHVENALYSDDRVKDAAVVAVPHEKLGEAVAAVVVLHSKHRGQVDEAELRKVVGAKLPKHCVPEMILFWKDMPRNATGKTLKTELKPKLKAEWEKRQAIAQKARL